MKIENDQVIFSSGRTRYANLGIIGLSPNMDVSEGYDGGFYEKEVEEFAHDEEDRLSKNDLIELADHMIERWKQFKARVERTEVV